MGDTVNGSSSIESNDSRYIVIDDSFSATSGYAPAEEREDNWVATEIQRPTAALRRKKLNGEAASLSNNTKTKSVAPQICRQTITHTNVPDKQFLVQFDTLYKQMNGKKKINAW